MTTTTLTNPHPPDEVVGYAAETADYEAFLRIAEALCGGSDKMRDHGNHMVVLLRRMVPLTAADLPPKA